MEETTAHMLTKPNARKEAARQVVLEERIDKQKQAIWLHFRSKYVPQFDDANRDANLDYIGETSAIVLLPLPIGAKFGINNAMIHFLTLKGVFTYLATIDSNFQLKNFVEIFNSYYLPRVR